ncbi:MAG: 5-bromo-4-chloroindolyl phosphate hydrolysis family protein [Oscillospiraceae bacterium]
MKKVIVHKSAAPIYIAAAAWGIYALVFPLYRVGHFVIAAAVSSAAYFVGRCFFKDVKEVIEVEPEPIRTGNQALNEMIAQGQLAMQEMRRLDDNIKDDIISGQIRKLEELSGKIFDQVKQTPEKLPQIRKFMNYYLPTTLKLLNTYDRMGAQGVSGGNIGATMERVENIMGTIVTAFEKQLDALFGAEALDISTDITVLENMMAREGLAEDAVHRTVNEEKEDKTEPSDGGIQLEL